MKNLQTFNEFIDTLNEAVNTQSLIKKNVKAMEKIIAKYGFSNNYSGGDGIYINLKDTVDPDDGVGPKVLHDLKDALIKYAKKDGIAILVNLDVYTSNVKKLNVLFPRKEINVRNVYHITSRKNVESILKNGLEVRAIQDHSNSFSGNKTATYKAVFGVYQSGGIKQVTNFFRFDDPVVLKIKPKAYTWYDDPLMPRDVPSILTYDNIKPEDISIK